MQAVIFDLDGVLVNSMPTHFQAWKEAFDMITGIRIAERDVYLLEGMRGVELVEKIFDEKRFPDYSLVRKVHEEKSRIFKAIRSSEPFDGVTEMIDDMKYMKAVVSGSTKQDVNTIIEEAFGKSRFDVIITANDIKKGKPDPSGFQQALLRMRVEAEDSVIVENAPLGVEAANRANIPSYVVLNNSPLTISDFQVLIPEDRVFEKTADLRKILNK